MRLDPHLYDALYNLGTVLYDSGRRDDARPYLQRFVNEAPPARYQQDFGSVTECYFVILQRLSSACAQ